MAVLVTPFAGMNTVSEDAALQIGGKEPRLFVRDAVNVDITPRGGADIRGGLEKVGDQRLTCLWQSPLHGDVFGVLGGKWVKVAIESWECEVLADLEGAEAAHAVLNNLVCVAGKAGIFTYDGAKARRLTTETPPSPMVTIAGDGSIPAGRYAVAVSWMKGSVESSVSLSEFVDLAGSSALEIVLPAMFDTDITGARIYMSKAGSGELLLVDEVGTSVPMVRISSMPDYGRAAMYANLSPMPTGTYLGLWRGRLMTARANVIRFSEALTYHLHDERYGFVQMPQRVTFILPVDGGIWVGQSDHVAFLEGADPAGLAVTRKASKAPVPGSAILVAAEVVGAELSGGGGNVALWLAENGYVVGTASGSIAEINAGKLSGIAAKAGTTTVVGRRVTTTVK